MNTKTNNCLQVSNEHDFDEILQSKGRVIALIYASWCPFCVRFLPVFQRYAAEKAGNFIMVQDDQEVIADRYDVEVVPTVLIFEKGGLSRRLDGVLGVGLSEKQLIDFLK